MLDAVVAGNMEALGVVRLEIRIRRLGAKAFEVVIEMVFGNHQREARVGMFVETFGDEDVGGKKHRTAPEFGEELRLDFQVADVFCVFRGGDGRNFLIEHDGEFRGGIDGDFLRLAV